MDASKSFEHEEGSSNKKPREVSVKHWRVERALVTYRNLFYKLIHQYKQDQPGKLIAKPKVLMEAATEMRKGHHWENTERRVGHVLGIEVGDRFQYRTELNIIGLHRQFLSGIDYMGNGENSLATSIVVTDRFDNVRKSSDTLIYIGHGGNPNVTGNDSIRDQKLEGGNLALKNSMDAESPVRVILKDCGKSDEMKSYSFVYDGLYLVVKMAQKRGEFGKLVFKFTLKRILEQRPSCVAVKDDVMNHGDRSGKLATKRHKSKGCVEKDVIRRNDFSQGKEKVPVRLVAPMDCVELPTSFDYIVNNIYPERLKKAILCGCDCTDGCGDPGKCACIVKNGGRIPYNCMKRLASLMESSLIYECGPSCKCSSSCFNRVSQHGIQFQLEIFMTTLKVWGLRTRSFIPSGSFVCEYIGVVSNNRQSGSRLDVDDYKFKMGVGMGYIDATRCGNIGRFINHSCSPNLIVKDVMYDHSDKNLPHKMLFAVKDIPAGRELSYDYNSSRVKFMKGRSKNCYCGAQECKRKIYI